MAENKFIAGWTLSNFGGVGVIEVNDVENTMLIQYYDEEPEEVVIQWDADVEDGEPFIMVGELQLFLSDCMRY